MNYIINPSWFYWVHVVNGLQILLGIFAGILVLVAFICFITAYDEYGDNKSKWEMRGTICTVTAVIFGVALIFIPSKSTLIEMQIAKFATYENAEWTIDKIKEAVDYIVSAIQNIKG